jgi:hypothetical protein
MSNVEKFTKSTSDYESLVLMPCYLWKCDAEAKHGVESWETETRKTTKCQNPQISTQ